MYSIDIYLLLYSCIICRYLAWPSNSSAITFEYHAFEALIATSVILFKDESQRIQSIASELLPGMQQGGIFPLEVQKRMIELKGSVGTAISKMELFKDCLTGAVEEEMLEPLIALLGTPAPSFINKNKEPDKILKCACSCV